MPSNSASNVARELHAWQKHCTCHMPRQSHFLVHGCQVVLKLRMLMWQKAEWLGVQHAKVINYHPSGHDAMGMSCKAKPTTVFQTHYLQGAWQAYEAEGTCQCWCLTANAGSQAAACSRPSAYPPCNELHQLHTLPCSLPGPVQMSHGLLH